MKDKKISEPHESNDVLWNDNLLLSLFGTQPGESEEFSSSSVAEDSVVPWRSETTRIPVPMQESQGIDSNNNSSNNNGDSSLSSQGNHRFLSLLLANCHDYKTKSPMEKPAVSLKILKQWRNQSPPGRFLVLAGSSGSSSNNPQQPVYKDMGDKKARNKISKALKRLSSSSSPPPMINSSHGREELEESSVVNVSDDDTTTDNRQAATKQVPIPGLHSATTSESPQSGTALEPVRECALDSFKQQQGISEAAQVDDIRHRRPGSVSGGLLLTPPKMPQRRLRSSSNSMFYERRISEQLNTAVQKQGHQFGRWKERKKLIQAFRQVGSTKFDDESSSRVASSVLSSVATPAPAKISKEVQFVVISGGLGVGKTSLAKTLQNPLLLSEEEGDGVVQSFLGDEFDSDDDIMGYNQRRKSSTVTRNVMPFFLVGKFVMNQWEDPNSVFVEVISDFCNQLLMMNRKRELMRRYRDALQEAMLDDIPLLSSLVPSLEILFDSKISSRIMDESEGSVTTGSSRRCCGDDDDDDRNDAKGVMAMHRIKQAFVKFFSTIAAVSPRDNPIIILLEDVQFLSEPAMEVLKFVVTDESCSGVLFLATNNTDQDQDKHFVQAIDQIKRDHRICAHDIQLGNLSEDSVALMLGEALSLPQEETLKVLALIYPITKGNPAFITELLRIFQERKMIRYDMSSDRWFCDYEEITRTLDTIKSVPDLFCSKINALPSSAQEALKIAACLSSSPINEHIVTLVMGNGGDSVDASLKLAESNGLLRCQGGLYYFASDSVRQAVMDFIPEGQRDSYHLMIGQRMWLQLHESENQNNVYYSNLVHQMMLSDHLVVEAEDRRSLASFYMQAGSGALIHLGCQTAGYCFSRALKVMAPLKKWGRDNYDLSLALHNKAVEVFYANGEVEKLDALITEVLENARTFFDTLPVRSTKIYMLGTRTKQEEAIDLALETLKTGLDEKFPSKKPSLLRVVFEGWRVSRLLKNMSDEDILAIKQMKDPKKIAAMQIMNHVLLHTLLSSPTLGALLIFRMVELSIQEGLSAMSSVGFSMYGYVLSSRNGDIPAGVRFGKLALKLGERFKGGVWHNRATMTYYGTVFSRKYPVVQSLEILEQAKRVAMRLGDVEYSIMSGCIGCWVGSEFMRLPDLETKIRQLIKEIAFYGQDLSMVMIKPIYQCTLCLMGEVEGDPKLLQGKLIDDDVRAAEATKNEYFLAWYRFCSMRLAYHFGDYDLAASLADTTYLLYDRNDTGGMDAAETMLYESLVLLKQVQRGNRNRVRTLPYVRGRLKLLKHQAEHCPANFLGKQLLLQAEVAATARKFQKAMATYRAAILANRDSGFYQEEGLANELLGKLYLDKNDVESAVPLLEEARRVYDIWGAKAKVAHFDKEFADYLSSP